MDEPLEPGNGGEPASRMSLAARLMNVFVAPGEVFAEVKDSPPTPSNWVVPMIIAMLAGVIYVMVVFSQPAIIQTMKEAREKQLQEQVTAGKMTQVQADKATEMTEKYMTPTVLMVFGAGGALVATPVSLFVFAFVTWLIGRFALRGQSRWSDYP